MEERGERLWTRLAVQTGGNKNLIGRIMQMSYMVSTKTQRSGDLFKSTTGKRVPVIRALSKREGA